MLSIKEIENSLRVNNVESNRCTDCDVLLEMSFSQMKCPECNKIYDMEIFLDSEKIDPKHNSYYDIMKKHMIYQTTKYNSKNIIIKDIENRLRIIQKEYIFDERIINECIKLLVPIYEDTSSRGERRYKQIGGALDIICKREGIYVPESLISKAFSKTGGISSGRNSILNKIFDNKVINSDNDNNVSISNQYEVINKTINLILHRFDLNKDKNVMNFIKSLVYIQYLYKQIVNMTLKAQISGSIYYYYLHVLNNNNIQKIVSVNDITKETVTHYYDYLKTKDQSIKIIARKLNINLL